MPAPLRTSGAVYRNRLADWADKYLFLVVFGLGTGLIFSLKNAGVRQLYVTVAPIAVMAVYAVYVIGTPRYRLRDDRAGDSLYYLGFLFTMVSLAYSLYEFGSPGIGTEAIVTNFGIALATTIVGLMLRVVYHQLRQDPVEVERAMRVELTDTAAKLHGHLLGVITDFASLRDVISQTLSETTTKAASAMTKVVEDAGRQHAESASQLANGVRTATADLKAAHDSMLASAKRTIAAVSRLADRVDNVQLPADILKTKLDAALGELERAVQQVRRRAEAEDLRLAQLEETLKAAHAAALAIRGEVEGLRSAVGSHTSSLTSATSDLQRSLQALMASANTAVTLARENSQVQQAVLRELSTSAASAVETIQRHRTQIESDVEMSQSMVSQVHGSLVSLTRLVTEKLDGTRSRV
jgi:hypothetical protein